MVAQGYDNPIEGGTTQVVTDQWNVPVPWLMVGSNTGSNTLFVSSGGEVNNQIGTIGHNASSMGNSAFVSGSNAVWNSALELSVGNLGSDNDLGIFGGGRVNTANAYIGKASSNNFVAISGEGSELSATTLHLGHTGSENSMGVFGGGRISSANASIGHWIGANGNYALVSGTNSVWDNAGTLNVGVYGADSMLMVTDAGTVRSAAVNVGAQFSSSNNTVSLWGDGALLDAGELNIGGTATTTGGTGNRVSVRDGATVATTDLTIHAGNNFDLNDGGTFAINSDFNVQTSGFNWNDGGHLSVSGSLTGMPVSVAYTYNFEMLDGSRRQLSLDGGSWVASGDNSMGVGLHGDGNSLNLTNGATAHTDRHFMMGVNAGADDNGVSVHGTGSLLEVGWGLIVGQDSKNNSLAVSDGGRVSSSNGNIGTLRSADNNQATVSGDGSRWDMTSGLIVGSSGNHNSLSVEDGGQLSSDYAYIGYGDQANSSYGYGNQVKVSGNGSAWSNKTHLTVGYRGSRNLLQIEDGGFVESREVVLGSQSGANGNSIIVDGNQSELSIGSGLYLGGHKIRTNWINGGTGNLLTVENGGRVLVGEMDESNLSKIGSHASIVVGGTNGVAEIIVGNGSVINSERAYLGLGEGETGSISIGKDSVWTNSDWLYVGKGGDGNSLLIQDGSKVDSGLTLIGYDASASNNSMVVTGAGSELDVSSIHVGREGSGNQLEILNGASASIGGLYMSSEGRSSNNVAIIDGVGSTMDVSELYVGYEGDGNHVQITGGGKVVADYTQLGRSFISADNSMLVSGEGSVLSNNNSMYVGYWGDNNSLVIADGGKVYTRSQFAMSDSAASTGNTVVVTGNGSVLESASGSFMVGISGGQNTMQVLDGAQVSNTGNALVGYQYQSDNNTVLVSGTNSAWRNTGKLSVGYSGEDNALLVSDGGLLTSKGAEIGRTDAAHNNLVLVSGEGSKWHNNGSLAMGGYEWNGWRNGGTNNTLSAQDGGWIFVGDADTNHLPEFATTGALVVGDAAGDKELFAANKSVVDAGHAFIGLGTSESGSVTLAGESRMDVRDGLYVGYASSGSEMNVTDGSTLNTESAFIGFDNTATGNVVNIDGATWNNNDDLYIGYAGSGNELNILNGGQVNNQRSTYIGQWATASNNLMTVSGEGSVMSNGNSIYVGYEGSGNALEINDGGSVESYAGHIGYMAGADGNRVSVSGTGSVWSTRGEYAGYFNVGRAGDSNALSIADGGMVDSEGMHIGWLDGSDGNAVEVQGAGSVLNSREDIIVGVNGAGNTLSILDGGRVDSKGGGIGLDAAASGNRVLVSGKGSEWNNSDYLYVGSFGSSNTMVIEDGGQVNNGNGFIGLSPSGSGNSVLVTGAGSVWNNREDLYLGRASVGNSMTVSDGGHVYNNVGYLGQFSGTDSNSVHVTGSGSIWQNREALYLGGYRVGDTWKNGGVGNSLTVDDGGWVFVGDGGSGELFGVNGVVVADTAGNAEMVVANGSSVQNAYGVIGSGDGYGRATVVGEGSVWSNSHSLVVGQNSSSNCLVVSDGGAAQAEYLYVGREGHGNSMVVSGGGQVQSDISHIGYEDGADGNRVVVSGENSVWRSGGLNVGLGGSGNSMWVEDGGRVIGSYGSIGHREGSDGNAVVVTGAGSVWSNRNLLAVGDSGAGNALMISAGGKVYNGLAFIGKESGASNNVVQVTGSGSEWKSSDKLAVGFYGSGNVLEVADGGRVEASSVVVGEIGSDGNRVLVSGEGSTLKVLSTGGSGSAATVANGYLYVGMEGSGNSLDVLDGATVENSYGVIGGSFSGSNNTVHISGTGSQWRNSEGLYLGGWKLPPTSSEYSWWAGGTGNSLTVQGGGWVLVGDVDKDDLPGIGFEGGIAVGDSGTESPEMIIANGSLVSSGEGYIGLGSNDTGSVVVQGEGSLWNNRRSLRVGAYGSGNRVAVQDGATLVTGDQYANVDSVIGMASTAHSNSVAITGEGSGWKNWDNLTVGYQGSGNALMVTNGGFVENLGDVQVAEREGSSNNLVRVAGNGSELDIRNSLYLGERGSGNQLEVLDGGQVSGYAGHIGYLAQADDNRATVSGDGAVWTNRNNVYVGHGGSGNTLSILEGGRVYNHNGYIGNVEGANANAAIVAGEGSVWSNRNGLYVGDEGYGNALAVSNGGHVYAEDAVVGYELGSSNNIVAVSENGSGLTVSDSLIVGNYGSGNSLLLEDGGSVQGGYISIGDKSGASHNSVVVGGSNSLMQSHGGLVVGYDGANNQLSLGDGAVVSAQYSIVGRDVSSSSNLVVVSDAGSEWRSLDLHMGYGGANNALYITDEGTVSASNSFIGTYSDNNIASIQHYGSVWSNSADFHVGYQGSSNMLTILNEGWIENEGDAFIGYDAMASGNAAMVSGNWSTWRNSGELHVGHNGSGNRLDVLDGAHTYAWDGLTIGHGATAHSNTVSVSGSGSFLNAGAPYMIARMRMVTNLPPVIITPIYGTIGGSGSLINPGGGTITIGGGNFYGGSGGSVINPGGELVIGNIGVSNLLQIGGGGSLIIATNNLVAIGGGSLVGSTNNLEIGDGTFTGGSGGLVVASESSRAGDPVTNSVILVPGTFPGYPLLTVDDMFSQLVVGEGGSFNTLEITDGATVASGTGVVGGSEGAWYNTASVEGSNSLWSIWGNLYIGGRMKNGAWQDGGQGNSLVVSDGGLVDIDYSLHNRNHSSIEVDPGSRINVGGDYYQDATSSLRFGVETNAAGAPLNALVSVAGTAEFEEGARIEYASNIGQLEFETFYTNKIVEADKLIVAGIEDPDSLDLEMLDASGTLVDVLFWENDADIYGLVGRVYLADSAGFGQGTMMRDLSREIDELSLLDNEKAAAMIDLLNGMTAEEQKQQLSQQYERGVPTYLHTRSMTEGMGEVKKHVAVGAKARRAAPNGAAGPYAADQGMQGWAKPYGSWADYSAQGDYSAYDHTVYGTVVGFDLAVDEALVGVAGGYGHSRIDQADGDQSDANTGYCILYLSHGTTDWFGDFNLAFGRSKIEQESGSAFGNKADYDASNFALYYGGGKEMMINRHLIVTPNASLLWSYYYQEGYTEESDYLAREVEMYERNSFLSSVGASVGWKMEFGTAVLQPELRLNWLHEFNSDADAMDYQIEGGRGGQYHFGMPAPVADAIEFGLGVSCRMRDRIDLVLDLDGRYGEDYSAYTLSGRAVVEF